MILAAYVTEWDVIPLIASAIGFGLVAPWIIDGFAALFRVLFNGIFRQM